MIADGVAEILVGVVVDAQFGLTLVLGAGGVLTELLQDSVSLLPPFTPRRALRVALRGSQCTRLLHGFRGSRPADVAALLDAILARRRAMPQAHLQRRWSNSTSIPLSCGRRAAAPSLSMH